MIQNTPNHWTNQYTKSNTHPDKPHGGSNSGLANGIGQDGHSYGMHNSRRGSLNQSSHKEHRLGLPQRKSHGGRSQGNEAPEVGSLTGFSPIREPSCDCFSSVINKSQYLRTISRDVWNLRDPTRRPAPYAASKIPIHRCTSPSSSCSLSTSANGRTGIIRAYR